MWIGRRHELSHRMPLICIGWALLHGTNGGRKSCNIPPGDMKAVPPPPLNCDSSMPDNRAVHAAIHADLMTLPSPPSPAPFFAASPAPPSLSALLAPPGHASWALSGWLNARCPDERVLLYDHVHEEVVPSTGARGLLAPERCRTHKLSRSLSMQALGRSSQMECASRYGRGSAPCPESRCTVCSR
jgi:hypothetical protein